MRFNDLKPGMVFDQGMPPRFLYIEKKYSNEISVIGIDSNVKPGDDEWQNINSNYDWEEYFQEANLVTDIKVKRQVFKDLLK